MKLNTDGSVSVSNNADLIKSMGPLFSGLIMIVVVAGAGVLLAALVLWAQFKNEDDSAYPETKQGFDQFIADKDPFLAKIPLVDVIVRALFKSNTTTPQSARMTIEKVVA